MTKNNEVGFGTKFTTIAISFKLAEFCQVMLLGRILPTFDPQYVIPRIPTYTLPSWSTWQKAAKSCNLAVFCQVDFAHLSVDRSLRCIVHGQEEASRDKGIAVG